MYSPKLEYPLAIVETLEGKLVLGKQSFDREHCRMQKLEEAVRSMIVECTWVVESESSCCGKFDDTVTYVNLDLSRKNASVGDG